MAWIRCTTIDGRIRNDGVVGKMEGFLILFESCFRMYVDINVFRWQSNSLPTMRTEYHQSWVPFHTLRVPSGHFDMIEGPSD